MTPLTVTSDVLFLILMVDCFVKQIIHFTKEGSFSRSNWPAGGKGTIRLADKGEEWERRGKLSFRNKMAATIALSSSCRAVRRLVSSDERWES